MHFDHELNTRGLLCPLPILKTRKALDSIAPGEVLKVISTDEGSVRDMEAFARQTRNELLATIEGGGDFVFFLKKGQPD